MEEVTSLCSSEEEQNEDFTPTIVYSVTFKCLGTTIYKEQRYQDILAEV